MRERESQSVGAESQKSSWSSADGKAEKNPSEKKGTTIRLESLSLSDQGAALIAKFLEVLGEDPERDGLRETPKRVYRAFKEMLAGYQDDPEDILAKVFDECHDEMIVVKAIPFTSICEHHLLPFVGTVDLGYLPGKVVGLSKLARLVDCFSRRLQIQERMTRQIAESIQEYLNAKGVAVVVRASHSCMACRGVRKPGAVMVTSAMLGFLREKPEARTEFLELCK